MDLKASRDRFSGLDPVSPPKEVEVELSNGVKGTIAIPHAVHDEDFLKSGHAPPTNKIALILHGQGGHRNYCYQKILAHKMAAELGMYSLRIDFRGCGESAEVADEKIGRILESDIEDIQVCAEYILNPEVNALKQKFVFSAVVAHSRGSVAMFRWAIQQNRLLSDHKTASQAILVPNLINCSSRFRSETVLDRYHIYDWDLDYIEQKALRYGKMQNVKITMKEFQSLAEVDLEPVRELDPYYSVLSIYGTHDTTIPKEDCAFFANVLNRGPYTHHLEVIDGADHNFYGVDALDDEEDEDENPHALPLNKNGFINYNYVASAIIIKYLHSDQELIRFNARTSTLGIIRRWKNVGGICNFRDLGGWPIYSSPVTGDVKKQLYVRPNLFLRCANTAGVDKEGIKMLQRLEVDTIFDLRSVDECEKDGVPKNLESAGIKRVHAPVFKHEDYSPESMALRFSNLTKSWYTYVDAYDHMLANGHESFRTLFEWIRDNPNKTMAFHCAAGKDRTGVFAMLLLLLAGVDDFTIAKEYELTTYGLRPDHERIKKIFMAGLAKMHTHTPPDQLNSLVSSGREGWTLENEGFSNLISSRSEAMFATIDLLNKNYGGILTYMTKSLGFSQSEVRTIYQNIVCDTSPDSWLSRDSGIPVAKF